MLKIKKIDFRFLYPLKWKYSTHSFTKNGICVYQKKKTNYCKIIWEDYEAIFYATKDIDSLEMAEGYYTKGGLSELKIYDFLCDSKTFKVR